MVACVACTSTPLPGWAAVFTVEAVICASVMVAVWTSATVPASPASPPAAVTAMSVAFSRSCAATTTPLPFRVDCAPVVGSISGTMSAGVRPVAATVEPSTWAATVLSSVMTVTDPAAPTAPPAISPP